MTTSKKPSRNVEARDLGLGELREGFEELRLTTQQDELLRALERIRNKIDIANIQRDGKWAIQTLDAIDEIAERAIARAKGKGQ